MYLSWPQARAIRNVVDQYLADEHRHYQEEFENTEGRANHILKDLNILQAIWWSQNFEFYLVVDLDERGQFQAHIEIENGTVIFQYGTEKVNKDVVLLEELMEDGGMSHGTDMAGLTRCLKEMDGYHHTIRGYMRFLLNDLSFDRSFLQSR